MSLEDYRKKRAFSNTSEPRGERARAPQHLFVVQEHHASRLHFDFRLEIGGVLKSWAVPRGPSLDPAQKRLAVQVEDHPVQYADFQGEIAEGNYGAGRVVIWDRGTYSMVGDQDPLQAWESGKLSFQLQGEKLKGQFNLVRMRDDEKNWLLIKSNDRYAKPGWKLETVVPSARTKPPTQKKAAQAHEPTRSRQRSDKRPKTDLTSTVAMNMQQALAANRLAGNVVLTIGNESVLLTHLDKVFWPAEGYTKGDLVQYYLRIAPFIVAYLQGRPLILKRFPNGIDGDFFFQHEFENPPPYLETERIEAEGGRMIDYAIVNNPISLLYLVNLGVIEQHPWHSQIGKIDSPDWMVFDLDPSPGVDFANVCRIAQALRGVLSKLGLESYPKTSGSRGMHLLIPLEPVHSYLQVADVAESIANIVTEQNRDLATLVRPLAKRESGRVYIDYLQNARGKTIAAPYSARARPAAPVSTPLAWDEVNQELSPLNFTIDTVPQRLKNTGDLFGSILHNPQSLEPVMEQLARAR